MFQNQKDIPFGIERKLQIQHESCGWTLYSERAHVENIFYSRFNYFMLIFTLFVSVIVAVYVSDDVNHKGCTIFFLSLWSQVFIQKRKNFLSVFRCPKKCLCMVHLRKKFKSYLVLSDYFLQLICK